MPAQRQNGCRQKVNSSGTDLWALRQEFRRPSEKYQELVLLRPPYLRNTSCSKIAEVRSAIISRTTDVGCGGGQDPL